MLDDEELIQLNREPESERVEPTPEEELRLAERRRARDLPFDHRPAAGAGLDDLDLVFFRQEYLPSAVAPEVLEQNRRPPEHQLASLRLLTSGAPNYGALLVLGRDPRSWVPGAYLQFLRVDGTGLTDPINGQRELSGPLHLVMRWLDELLEINISVATTVAGAPREQLWPDYPIDALWQLTRNALIHRSYEGTNAPVRLYWFNDRIEISNPGGLFGQVHPDNFGQEGITDYRNPLIAEAMHVLGYVQRFGLGIPLAREALSKNGNPPPEFRFEPTHFLVTVRPRP